MLLEPLLAINISVPDGARSIAAGVLPVGVAPPLAVNNPVLRSMLKDDTDGSPRAATKSAPVPEVVPEVELEHAVKQNNKPGSAMPARNRNFVPILFLPSPCPSPSLLKSELS